MCAVYVLSRVAFCQLFFIKRILYCIVLYLPEFSKTAALCSLLTYFITYVCVQCSEECGGGERRRVVVCLSADNHDVVSDSLCNMTARPTELEHCNLHSCGTGRVVCRLIDCKL